MIPTPNLFFETHISISGPRRRLGQFRKELNSPWPYALPLTSMQIARNLASTYGGEFVKAWHTNFPL